MFLRSSSLRITVAAIAVALATAGTSFASGSTGQERRGDDFALAQPKTCTIAVHPVYHTATLICNSGQVGSLTYLLTTGYTYHVSLQTTGSTPIVARRWVDRGLYVRISLGGAAGRVTVERVVGHPAFGP
jgi:hypothetical protein